MSLRDGLVCTSWTVVTLTVLAVNPLFAVDAAAPEEPQFEAVFVSGEGDYALIRTPQILTTADDTLLVFAQGRTGGHDQSANDIILKRSDDGGQTWSGLRQEKALEGPACAAGFLKYSSRYADDKSRILFSLPVLDGRKTGTVWLSYDGGRTWPVSKSLRPDRFAYSCLTRLPDERIGCVFGGRAETVENGSSRTKSGVILARFSLEWLTDGSDAGP